VPRAWTVERRGLEPIPDGERHGSVFSMLWTWAAANIGILGVTLGAGLVTSLGLNLWQALIAAAVGSAGSFAFVALISLRGRATGTPVMVASRATFGVLGNLPVTLVSWIVLAGWEAAMCTTATLALVAVLNLLGVDASPGVTAAAAVAIVAGAAVIAWFGHATIWWLQKWLAWVVGALTVVVCGFAISTVNWVVVLGRSGTDIPDLLTGIGVIAAGTGVGWLSAGGDYTRYLPATTRPGGLLAATLSGAGVPLTLLIGTGSLLAFGNPATVDGPDPVGSVGLALPDWLLVPYLLTAMLGLLAAADLSMYSSGLNLQALGLPLRRRLAVVVTAIPVAAVTVFVTITSTDAYALLTAVVAAFAIPLAAWAGVVVVDILQHRHPDADALLDTRRGGAYWYTAGVHWPAVAAWVGGIALALPWTRVQFSDHVGFAGFWSDTWIGHSSLGWLLAGLAAMAIYWVLEPVSQRQESAAAARAAD
jgi:purine-cytosine permease-like protein